MAAVDLPPCVPTRSTKLPNGVCVASEDAPVAPISPLLLPSDESIADGGHRVRAHVHPDLTGSRTWISIFGSSVLMKPAWLGSARQAQLARFQHEEEEDYLVFFCMD